MAGPADARDAPRRAMVVGSGASGTAAVRHLIRLGAEVLVVDDAPSDAGREALAVLGVELVERPSLDRLSERLRGVDVLVPSPGVPEGHPAIVTARDTQVPVLSEVELAWRSITCPVVAVTGTNGKTTVVTLTAAMLRASGRSPVAAGNIGLALSDVVGDVARGAYDVVVLEVSSFQLRFVERFRPDVGVWLNLAPDHLDWHPDRAAYAAAKARIWENQKHDDVAVANVDDAVVMAAAAASEGRVVTFGAGSGATGAGSVLDADWQVVDQVLRGPAGVVVSMGDGIGRFPHERANVAAAAAAAWSAGATPEGMKTALADFHALAHRLSPVAERDGVSWYDDSKATNPAAALAAISGFPSVVLIAGGRNKGLDLAHMASVPDTVRAVVAIGECAGEVVEAFTGIRPVRVAGSMDDAVRFAADAAYPGDAVLLSPGCASFDWYHSYAERGDDFTRAVHDFLQENER